MPFYNKALNSLQPKFKPIVLEILTRLEAKGWQPIVAEGLRTVEQQREKVRLGYSQTMNSYHLTGMAADIVDKRYLWNIPLSHQYWKDQGEVVLELAKTNPGLRWGGVWAVGKMQRFVDYLLGKTKYFVDVAHVELRV
jgi:hypothetical protein